MMTAPEDSGGRTYPAPVLAVAGWSGSGKTTLLELAIPALTARGLCVAVVKHASHGLTVDRPGKDSDRLFRAGADIVIDTADETLSRWRPWPIDTLDGLLNDLGARHDLVLVEGHKGTPLPKIWLASPDDPVAPPDAANVLEVLAWDSPRLVALVAFIDRWFGSAWRERPLFGAVLVGGRSSRMGTPKHLLRAGGRTLLDRAVTALAPLVSRVVIVGAGMVPDEHIELPRLADVPGLEGPLAGMTAALRWAPDAAWIMTACDHPLVSVDAIAWLAGERAPGRWGILPLVEDEGPQPFPGLYEPQVRSVIELLSCTEGSGPSMLAGTMHIVSPAMPPPLAAAWRNVNRPEEFEPYT